MSRQVWLAVCARLGLARVVAKYWMQNSMPIPKKLTKSSLVNAFMLGLWRREEHICSIIMSRENFLSWEMLNLRKWMIENKSPLTQIVMMRVSPTLLVLEMLIQRGARVMKLKSPMRMPPVHHLRWWITRKSIGLYPALQCSPMLNSFE